MIAAGVLIYAGVGVAGLLLGGNYLDYFVLAHDPVHGQERGIFWVEVGVLDHRVRRDARRSSTCSPTAAAPMTTLQTIVEPLQLRRSPSS